MVVSADSGGVPCMGSNYLLKGCKGTYFEGGIRALGLLKVDCIPDKMKI